MHLLLVWRYDRHFLPHRKQVVWSLWRTWKMPRNPSISAAWRVKMWRKWSPLVLLRGDLGTDFQGDDSGCSETPRVVFFLTSKNTYLGTLNVERVLQKWFCHVLLQTICLKPWRVQFFFLPGDMILLVLMKLMGYHPGCVKTGGNLL